MNCKKLYLASIFIITCSLNQAFCQESSKVFKQDFPLVLSYNNHSWAFPFSSVLRMNPQYPGFTLGTEINYRVREKTKLFQSLEIGGFINPASGNATYFNSDLGFRFTSKKSIFMDLGFGFGLLKSYHINDTYKQQEDGLYSLVKDKGITALSQNIFIGAGYDLSKKYSKNFSLFVRYQWIASAAYWSNIIIRPNGLFHLGIRKSLRTNK